MCDFEIKLLSETAKAPTRGWLGWNLYADSFAHNGMQDVSFDLGKSFYGSKINGRATKDGYILHPKGRILVRTGLRIGLPIDHYAEIIPNSTTSPTALYSQGLLIERKIIHMGGKIDFVAVNLGHKPIEIIKGETIAELMIKPLCDVDDYDMEIKRFGEDN